MSQNNEGKEKWTYTHWNWTEADVEKFKLLTTREHRCAAELSEEGKPHLQGALTFTRKYRLTQLKKLFPETHWETALTRDPENYCIKGPIMINVVKKQGDRTDLKKVAKAVRNGKNMQEIAEEFPVEFIKFNKGITAWKQAMLPQRNWKMDVHILWGPSGTGKTREVWDTWGTEGVVYPKMKNKWWDHYTGQDVVLIDDFDPSTTGLDLDFLLCLLDRYPMFVEYKGGSCNFCSKMIYITSNINPKEWFNGRTCEEAFFRRVTSVREVT